MNILHIHDSGYIKGGAEVVLSGLVEQQQKQGHIIRVLSPASPNNTFATDTFIQKNGPTFLKAYTYTWNREAVKAVSRTIASFHPDIIHIHSVTESSAAYTPLFGSIPSVMTVHNFGFIDPSVTNLPSLKSYEKDLGPYFTRSISARFIVERIRHRFVKKQLSKIDCFLPVSHFLEDVIHEYAPAWKTQVIHPGVPMTVPTPPPKEPVLLAIGRMVPEKGFTDLLDILPTIISSVPKVQLFLVGDGPELATLKYRAHKNGLMEHIKFLGNVDTNDVTHLYKKSRAIVVPSHWPEPFGLIGPEAMMAGRPVVAYNVGGISEWLTDQKTGYLVNPGNKNLLAQSLIRILTDSPEYLKLAQGAIEKGTFFSVELYAKRQESIYNEMLFQKKSHT